MRTMDDEALTAIAQRLYGLRPEEFTRARDAEAKQAKADGDRAAAAAIAALRRPSLAAWLVNALMRDRPAEIEQLIGLGEALATAQRGLAGDEVRALGRQRQQLLAAMGRQARALARELGHPVSDDVGQEVEQTLGAAMVDPAVAEAVRSGRLTSPTSYAGLGLGEEEPAPRRHLSAVPSAPATAASATTSRATKPRAANRRSAAEPDPERDRLEQERRDEEARRREVEARRREEERRAAELAEAREEEREAHEALTAALETSRAAQARLDDAEHAEEDARRRIADLQEQLRRAEADLTTATRDERTLRRERDAAARVADLAERAARRARERVERLEPPD
jgi:hypothetical protein